jgi:hypothetical protein
MSNGCIERPTLPQQYDVHILESWPGKISSSTVPHLSCFQIPFNSLHRRQNCCRGSIFIQSFESYQLKLLWIESTTSTSFNVTYWTSPAVRSCNTPKYQVYENNLLMKRLKMFKVNRTRNSTLLVSRPENPTSESPINKSNALCARSGQSHSQLRWNAHIFKFLTNNAHQRQPLPYSKLEGPPLQQIPDRHFFSKPTTEIFPVEWWLDP